MKIWMISPEVTPLVKVGGLADVVGALSVQLAKEGHDVRIVCPRYSRIQWQPDWIQGRDPLVVRVGDADEHAGVWQTTLPGGNVTVYLIEHWGYYGRGEVYADANGGYSDNDRRFTFFSRASIDLLYYLNWFPDVVHCHDWTSGLVPVYLNTTERYTQLGKCSSVYTIHNLEHQGIFGRWVLDYARLPQSLFRPDGLESLGACNLMKGALYHARKLTTVSPTYAREIQEPAEGCGLHHVLRFKAGDLVGILNGIDVEEWNPQKDPLIAAPYSANDFRGKDQCKSALQKEMGLTQDPSVPLFGVVSRLYAQKGLDLLLASSRRVLDTMNIQLVLLGAGDGELQAQFQQLARDYPGRVSVYIGFNNALAHQIEAGSDFFLMPSRFEPCGLNQMYSQRYGTLPIVRETGGLLDTVDQYVEGTGKGSGFRFQDATADALYDVIGWACSTYYDRPQEFFQMRRNAMAKDFSWRSSAAMYEQVYQWSMQ
jgi:starch synthase